MRAERAIGLLLAVILAVAIATFPACSANAAVKPAAAYDLRGPYPTTQQCRAYDRGHAGVEGWRLWVRRNAWRQARNVLAHRPGWHYVWNEDWVLPVAQRECGGDATQVTPPLGCAGPMQLLPAFAHGRNLCDVQTNFSISSMLFSRLGPRPWACTMSVGISPYARNLR